MSVVVFDLGGVVRRFTPDHRLERLAAISGRSPQEILQAI
jgi:hypothetical protein